MSSPYGPGTLQWREHRELAVGTPTPRRSDYVQHDPYDEQDHAQCCQRPAGQPERNAPDIPPEGARGRRWLTAVLDGVADRFDEAQVGKGEDAEAHHEHHEARPGEPSCLGLGRGDFAEEILALLVDVLNVGDVLVT